MPEALGAALEISGLGWVFLAALTAGCVYGFAGFGSALVFVPFAVAFVPPAVVIPAFHLSALISVFTVLPAAVHIAERRTTAILVITSTIAAPLGVYLLIHVPEDITRWAVSGIVGITLLALLFGWRYQTAPGLATTSAVGCAAGTMGGATGLNGPIVILFRLAGQDKAAQNRANMIVFLTLNSLLVIPFLVLGDVMTWPVFWLGLILLLPYGLGTLLGQALFQPQREGIYRTVAYLLIAIAALVGLPIW